LPTSAWLQQQFDKSEILSEKSLVLQPVPTAIAAENLSRLLSILLSRLQLESPFRMN
jgi:hypothetical protein